MENDPRDEAAESRRSDADEPAKETPMDASMAAAPTNRDVPPDQRTLDERIKRVRKLRWIGLEDEARRVQAETVCVVPPEPDTD